MLLWEVFPSTHFGKLLSAKLSRNGNPRRHFKFYVDRSYYPWFSSSAEFRENMNRSNSTHIVQVYIHKLKKGLHDFLRCNTLSLNPYINSTALRCNIIYIVDCARTTYILEIQSAFIKSIIWLDSFNIRINLKVIKLIFNIQIFNVDACILHLLKKQRNNNTC